MSEFALRWKISRMLSNKYELKSKHDKTKESASWMIALPRWNNKGNLHHFQKLNFLDKVGLQPGGEKQL